MGNILICGADVITLDVDGAVLRGADVAICDGLIAAVGAVPDDFQPDEIIEAHHHILMPGLYNAHMHSGTVLSRAVGGPDVSDPWFDLRVTKDAQVNHAIRSPMTPEAAYWAASLAAAEMIRGGVVGFMDQYFYMDQVARVVLESGLRANLAWCTFGDEGGEIGGDVAAIAAFTESWRGAGKGRIQTSFGPHSPYMCSPQFLARTAAVAARLGVDIHLRLAESREQVELSLLAYDMTPVQVLDQNGVLDLPVVAANVAYLSDFDLDILLARGVRIVVCPKAQAAAGLAVSPMSLFHAAGIDLALGTDGAGLAGSLDMFEVFRSAASHLSEDEQAAGLALGLATWGGARVLGFANCGRLAPEHAADLLMIDCHRPHLWPVRDPLGTVLHSVRAGDVTDVMVAGQWLMRKGKLVTIDEEHILAETGRRGEIAAGW